MTDLKIAKSLPETTPGHEPEISDLPIYNLADYRITPDKIEARAVAGYDGPADLPPAGASQEETLQAARDLHRIDIQNGLEGISGPGGLPPRRVQPPGGVHGTNNNRRSERATGSDFSDLLRAGIARDDAARTDRLQDARIHDMLKALAITDDFLSSLSHRIKVEATRELVDFEAAYPGIVPILFYNPATNRFIAVRSEDADTIEVGKAELSEAMLKQRSNRGRQDRGQDQDQKQEEEQPGQAESQEARAFRASLRLDDPPYPQTQKHPNEIAKTDEISLLCGMTGEVLRGIASLEETDTRRREQVFDQATYVRMRALIGDMQLLAVKLERAGVISEEQSRVAFGLDLDVESFGPEKSYQPNRPHQVLKKLAEPVKSLFELQDRARPLP